jgi:hypothetical protein
MLSDRDWEIRLAVYLHIVAHGQPPTYAEVALDLNLPAEEVRHAFRRLHEQHALFLAPGTDAVLMANPFSAIPTAFRVEARGRRYWANCAWDSLGIPAALHADGWIEAMSAYSGQPMRYAIVGGALRAGEGVVHFSLPFRHWYDDLIHT